MGQKDSTLRDVGVSSTLGRVISCSSSLSYAVYHYISLQSADWHLIFLSVFYSMVPYYGFLSDVSFLRGTLASSADI